MEQQPFEFKLLEIFVKHSSVNAPKEDKKWDDVSVDLEFAYDIKIEPEDEFIRCKLHFRYVALDEEDEANKEKAHTLVHADIGFLFKVKSLNKYLEDMGDKWKIEKGPLMTLLMVSYSTSRGIIYEKCRGYEFESLILPVIHPSELVDQLEFEKEETNEKHH